MIGADEEAFLNAIKEKPDDSAPRLIYTDWLEEHERIEEALAIRKEVVTPSPPVEEFWGSANVSILAGKIMTSVVRVADSGRHANDAINFQVNTGELYTLTHDQD